MGLGDRGASLVAAGGEPSDAAVMDWLHQLVAELDPLIEDAERVVDGDPDASARWRALLAWVPADVEDHHGPAQRQVEVTLVDAPATGGLDPDAVQTLWAATVAAARNETQLWAMTGRLLELLGPVAALGQLLAAPAPIRPLLMAGGLPGLPPGGLPGLAGGELPRGPGGLGLPKGGIGGIAWPGGKRKPVGGGPGDVIDVDSAREMWERLFRPGLLDPRVPCDALELILGIRYRRDAGDYDITRLEPSDACAGEVMTIHGTNFKPGLDTVVVFPSDVATVTVPVASATSTEISVVVPSDAVSGPVRVRTVLATVQACGKSHSVTQRGNSRPFSGGRPLITSLRVDGRDSDCWAAGTTATVEWTLALPAPSSPILSSLAPGTPVTVRVVDDLGTALMPTQHAWPAVRSATVTLPNRGRWAIVSVEYANRCASTRRELKVWLGSAGRPAVAGIEVTQGIQHHLRVLETWDTADRTSWNSLELIAGKPTVVRVYPVVRYDPPGTKTTPFDLTAELRLLHPVTGDQVGPTLVPLQLGADGLLHAGVRLTVGATPPDRRRTAQSFNFHVPAAYASGELDVRVKVTVVAGDASRTTTSTHRARWRSKASLNVHYVRVFGKGGGPVPLSDQQARQGVAAGLELLPFPVLRVAPSPTPVMGNDEVWTARDGNERLIDELIEISDEYDDTRYVGVVNTSVPVPIPGLSGTAAWPAGEEVVCWATREPIVIAHELTHLFHFADVTNQPVITNVPFDIPRMTTLNDLVNSDAIVDFMQARSPVAPNVPPVGAQGGLPIRPISVSEASWAALAANNSPW